MAITKPTRLNQAVGSDVLGVATAALFVLAPRAIRTVAGWFSGDQAAPHPSHELPVQPPDDLEGRRSDRRRRRLHLLGRDDTFFSRRRLATLGYLTIGTGLGVRGARGKQKEREI